MVKMLYNIFIHLLIILLRPHVVTLLLTEQCNNLEPINEHKLMYLTKYVIPDMCGKHKGEAGKIAVIGGSYEYTGAPYFAAMAALKVGADLVYVITTKTAAPVIKSYSPDLIVIPYLSAADIHHILKRMDLVIIGPGLGREADSLKLVYSVIDMCRNLKKPLVIDADGLYAIFKNITVLKDLPSPGAVLTPNHVEAQRIKEAIPSDVNMPWYSFWGNFVSILEKGAEDQYHSPISNLNWTLSYGGSCRRAGGQGDILAGALGTFLNWALKSNICENNNTVQISQSIATFAAAKLTRVCNFNAFKKFGRSMLASDMLNDIHFSFESTFTL